ncbi:MAG TPA: hypothetical protein VFE72_04015 [Lysobacter sp.]|nr:hypothetical protein [Lysobacter sp.]
MTYADWEDKAGISPVSPEAAYAESAWNAAIDAAQNKLVESGNGLLAEVIAGLDTGFRMKHD